MIKAVGFDYGGVIELYESGSPLQRAAELLPIPISELRDVYFRHNHRANVENLDWHDMFREVLSGFSIGREKEDEVMATLRREYETGRRINTEVVALFPKLRDAGLQVGILSNANATLRETVRQNGIARLVNAVVISGEIGFQKPNPEAFHALFEKLNLRAEEVVFIDDSPKSLERSGEIGYLPLRFENTEQLMADLKGIGISV